MSQSPFTHKEVNTRSGKYRHLFGDNGSPESSYVGLKASSTGESTFVKANAEYLAAAKTGGGGPVYICRLDRPGRFPADAPTLNVHKNLVLDFDFHPFIDNMIATGSEDTHVCVSKFPTMGLKKAITEPDIRLQGHTKKVALVEFNPCASSILATASFDHTVRTWNIETGSAIGTYEGLTDNVYSMGWNHDGSLFAVTGKDKKLQIFDPRKPSAAQVVDSFDGAKSSKLFWAPCLNWIGATGHTKTSQRQIKCWDLKNMSKPIVANSIDQEASVLQPMYDDDNGVLYLVGKGDGTINYYELVNDDKKVYLLGTFRNAESQKGGGWVAKRALDVWKCEIARFLRLTSKGIVPVSFIVPRKSGKEVFQADIFPDAFAGKPSLSAQEWIKGVNKPPILMSLDPSVRQDITVDENGNTTFARKKTYEELVDENGQLKERTKELEIKLGIYDSTAQVEQKENDDNNGNDNDNNNENNDNNDHNDDNNDNDEAKDD